jgi:hypothetical protein
MFAPNQAVFAGTDVGRVVYYDIENLNVVVLHRKNDYTWYEKTHPSTNVTAMIIPLPWDLKTPFMSPKYVAIPKSWLDSFWSLLAG